jgi:hypothetical protein
VFQLAAGGVAVFAVPVVAGAPGDRGERVAGVAGIRQTPGAGVAGGVGPAEEGAGGDDEVDQPGEGGQAAGGGAGALRAAGAAALVVPVPLVCFAVVFLALVPAVVLAVSAAGVTFAARVFVAAAAPGARSAVGIVPQCAMDIAINVI